MAWLMYQLDIQTPTETDPWAGVDFCKRFQSLCQRKARRVAYIYETPDTSTFRYRCWNMAETLNQYSQDVSAGCFYLSEFERAEEIVNNADVLVICRVRWDHRINHFVTQARTKGRLLLYDIDDMVFDPSIIPVVMESLQVDLTEDNLNFWFAYAARLQTTLSFCDGYITTNPFLASILRTSLPNGREAIVPNFLNKSQMDISKLAMEHKTRNNFQRDDNIHIGYFSGTPTHARDLAIAEQGLAQILEDEPAARLHLVGFIEPQGPLRAFTDRIDRCGLTNFRNLQLLLARTEINIAPLNENLFTNCKSELKWFEAAVAGSITIASPTFPFRNAIKDGYNGFLAPVGSWYSKLKTAIEQVGEIDFIRCAASDAESRYSWELMSAKIETAIFG